MGKYPRKAAHWFGKHVPRNQSAAEAAERAAEFPLKLKLYHFNIAQSRGHVNSAYLHLSFSLEASQKRLLGDYCVASDCTAVSRRRALHKGNDIHSLAALITRLLQCVRMQT